MAAVVRTAHTAHLPASELAAARALLEDVFAGELTEQDWEHCLGGMHALVWEDGDLVGHAAVVQRRLLHAGRALRAGYVEGVAVRSDRRRRGYGMALMAELERVIQGGYHLGALGSTEVGAELYGRRGWLRWPGRTSALTPSGVVPTPDEDGWIYVLPLAAGLDPEGELTCDWREGDLW